MIVLIGIIIAIFLSFILGSKKGKSLSDKILLAWLFALAITLILYKLQTEELRNSYPFLLGWIFPMPLLQWPFLYLYVLSLSSKKPLKLNLILHFLPFVLSFLLFSKYLFLPNEIKLDIYNRHGEGYELEMNINLLAIILSALTYTILSCYELWKHKQNIKNEFSYTEKITLNWLLFLVIGMTCILIIIFFRAEDYIIYSSVTGIVLYIGYFGIKQVGIFSEKSNLALDQPLLNEINSEFNTINLEESSEPIKEKIKYQKSKLSEEETKRIHSIVNKLMIEEKLYKNPEISLADLAQKISVHPNILSQVINSIEGKNFYDYINFHRVEEFQRLVLLPNSNQYTLLSLAFESGFNSKTSFNRNFKKVTNLSPSDFLKQENILLKK